jgi:hypothetical protein
MTTDDAFKSRVYREETTSGSTACRMTVWVVAWVVDRLIDGAHGASRAFMIELYLLGILNILIDPPSAWSSALLLSLGVCNAAHTTPFPPVAWFLACSFI